MADFIIKPTSGNLILKDDQNVARMTIAPTSGATTLSNQVFPAGHVIQTITAMSNTEVNAGTNAGYVTITNMAGTITPKYSTSKIIISMGCGTMMQSSMDSLYTKITGTTTGTVFEGTRYPGYYASGSTSAWDATPIALKVVDTPGSVAAQTYQLYCKIQTGTTAAYWRVCTSNYGLGGVHVGVQNGSIILQEISV